MSETFELYPKDYKWTTDQTDIDKYLLIIKEAFPVSITHSEMSAMFGHKHIFRIFSYNEEGWMFKFTKRDEFALIIEHRASLFPTVYLTTNEIFSDFIEWLEEYVSLMRPYYGEIALRGDGILCN